LGDDLDPTHLLETLDNLVPSLFSLGQFFVEVLLGVLNLVPDALSGLGLDLAGSNTLECLLAFLVGGVEVEPILALLLAWSSLVGGVFSSVGSNGSGIGKEVTGKEDGVRAELAESWVGDDQRGNGSEGRNCSLGISGHFLSRRRRSGVDVDIDISVGGIIL